MGGRKPAWGDEWHVIDRHMAARLTRALSLRISPRGNDRDEAVEAAEIVAQQVLDFCLARAESIRLKRMEKSVRQELRRDAEAKRQEREQRRIG